MATVACAGCGIVLEHVEIGMHPYIGASPGCWALYNELHAKQYAGFGARTQIRVIDAYCVQHPGMPERRTIQSVNAHLVALYLQLEKGYTDAQVNAALQGVLKFANQFEWLAPPTPNGTLTIAEILKAETPEEQATTIENYARAVWEAWQGHRAVVEKWAGMLR